MQIAALDETLAVSPQLTVADVAEASRRGFRSIVAARPDGEDADQPSIQTVRAAALARGMGFAAVPVVPGSISDGDVQAFRAAMDALPKPVVGYCRTGARAASLWALSRAGTQPADALLRITAAAGYDCGALRDRLAAPPVSR